MAERVSINSGPGGGPKRGTFADNLLDGQVALITGGGTGLGRAVALEFAACGADVVLAGRRTEPLERVAEEVTAGGGRVLTVPGDIREPEQVTSLVDRAIGRFGRIDILVNNAGGQFAAPAEDISPKGFRAVHRLAVDAT